MSEYFIETLTPAQAWDRAEMPAHKDAYAGQANAENWKPAQDWDLGAGYKKSIEMARYGWPEGSRKVSEVSAHVDEILNRVISGRSFEYDVTGELPDVGAMMTGQPEYMLGMAEAPVNAPVVRIVVNIVASASVDAEVMLLRGIIACSLVDALERQGTRCEVLASFASGRYEVVIPAKAPHEPLNIDRLAFLLAHPAASRRICFRLMENCDDAKSRRQTHCGYGSCRRHEVAPGDIVIEELYARDRNYWTPERLADEVKKYLKKAGVEMTELA